MSMQMARGSYRLCAADFRSVTVAAMALKSDFQLVTHRACPHADVPGGLCCPPLAGQQTAMCRRSGGGHMGNVDPERAAGHLVEALSFRRRRRWRGPKDTGSISLSGCPAAPWARLPGGRCTDGWRDGSVVAVGQRRSCGRREEYDCDWTRRCPDAHCGHLGRRRSERLLIGTVSRRWERPDACGGPERGELPRGHFQGGSECRQRRNRNSGQTSLGGDGRSLA